MTSSESVGLKRGPMEACNSEDMYDRVTCKRYRLEVPLAGASTPAGAWQWMREK